METNQTTSEKPTVHRITLTVTVTVDVEEGEHTADDVAIAVEDRITAFLYPSGIDVVSASAKVL